ncbi:MAG: 30S ribosomal protein S7, partial [Dehalococcoidia bacterium]|nr:30S ribosomal protein S7 [Dehalococcoidia bacterium]
MARRRRATKRETSPDPKYNSAYVAGFINRVMTRGKKSTAQRIV